MITILLVSFTISLGVAGRGSRARPLVDDDQQPHCGKWGYTKACTDHGCSICQLKWDVRVPLSHICVANETAAAVSFAYDCCSGVEPGPSPTPSPTPSPHHVIPSNACEYSSPSSCTDNSSCVWCESSSNQFCTLWEDARQLSSSYRCYSDYLSEPRPRPF